MKGEADSRLEKHYRKAWQLNNDPIKRTKVNGNEKNGPRHQHACMHNEQDRRCRHGEMIKKKK